MVQNILYAIPGFLQDTNLPDTFVEQRKHSSSSQAPRENTREKSEELEENVWVWKLKTSVKDIEKIFELICSVYVQLEKEQ